MSRCAGYDTSYAEMSKKEDGPLPCLPSTILYGHTASRGLDVRRWSVGLDTGCVSIIRFHQSLTTSDVSLGCRVGKGKTTYCTGPGEEARASHCR
jgi:hypothetical protein